MRCNVSRAGFNEPAGWVYKEGHSRGLSELRNTGLNYSQYMRGKEIQELGGAKTGRNVPVSLLKAVG